MSSITCRWCRGVSNLGCNEFVHMFQLRSERMCHFGQSKGSFLVFFSLLALPFPYLILSRWTTSGDVREVVGSSYLTLTDSCQVKMRRSILRQFAGTGSLGVKIITATRILLFIPWFPWILCFFRHSVLTPIISQPNKGQEAFRKELASWKNRLVFSFREDGGLAESLQSEGTWWHTKPVLNSPCDRLQVCVFPLLNTVLSLR